MATTASGRPSSIAAGATSGSWGPMMPGRCVRRPGSALPSMASSGRAYPVRGGLHIRRRVDVVRALLRPAVGGGVAVVRRAADRAVLDLRERTQGAGHIIEIARVAHAHVDGHRARASVVGVPDVEVVELGA